MRALLVVSGPPGAGKTTVSRILAAGFDRSVHVHADDFWHYVVSGFVEPWLPGSEEQNAVVMSAVASTAERFVEGGYATVVDTVVGPWFVDPFLRAARSCGIALGYAVLRPGEEVAVQRATSRGEGLEDEGPIRALHRQFADLGELESHVIDSSAMPPEAIAAALRDGLEDGRFTIR